MSVLDGAEQIVNGFAARGSTPAFSAISKQKLVDGLRERIANPLKINQGGANLCGPASLVYSMALRDRAAYASFVINLYEKGEARIGKFVIRPSEQLKKYDPPDNKIHDSDWVPMASIRNSKGSFVLINQYDHINDAGAGITVPADLRSWLEEVGYQKVIDRTSVFGMSFKEGKANLERAILDCATGFQVFLLILAELLGDGTGSVRTIKTKLKKRSYGFPNHWVVLHSGVIVDQTVRLIVYSWGGSATIPPAGSAWTLNDVLGGYCGHIAAIY